MRSMSLGGGVWLHSFHHRVVTDGFPALVLLQCGMLAKGHCSRHMKCV